METPHSLAEGTTEDTFPQGHTTVAMWSLQGQQSRLSFILTWYVWVSILSLFAFLLVVLKNPSFHFRCLQSVLDVTLPIPQQARHIG
jgi:hypothetical protein